MKHYRRAIHHHRLRPSRLLPHSPTAEHAAESDEMLESIFALHLIYHDDFEADITSIIHDNMLVARYTKIRDVIGARTDMLHGTDFAPHGQNNLLIIVGGHDVIVGLADAFRGLRQNKGHGLRGYILPVDGLI